MASAKPRAWLPYFPTLLVSTGILVVAAALGGPIAAAIAAFAVLPALLGTCLVVFLVFRRYSPASNFSALGVGFAIFVAVAVVVVVGLDAFGPSQIM